jgi:molecular chaperone GrpE
LSKKETADSFDDVAKEAAAEFLEEIGEEGGDLEEKSFSLDEENLNGLDTSILTDDVNKKLQEAEEKYMRVHADFENIKKRLEREKYQAIEYASEKFAKDLLSPIDTLEMALSSANTEADPAELLEKMKTGIELTIKSFRTAFEKHGIELVDTDGEFDPNCHDAVMQTPSEDHADGEIVQVMQKGYMYKERLLRPAMVSICKK